jgi:hypothetical protein
MAQSKRPKSIGGRVGKHTSKSVKTEFTEDRKEGGGGKPSAKKGARVRRPIPTIRSRKKHQTS